MPFRGWDVIFGTCTEGQICQLPNTQQTSAAHASMKCWGSPSSEAGPLQLPSSSPVFPNVSWSIKAPPPYVMREVWGPCQLARLDYSWSSNLASTPTTPELLSSLDSGEPGSWLFQDKTKNSRWSPFPPPIMCSFLSWKCQMEWCADEWLRVCPSVSFRPKPWPSQSSHHSPIRLWSRSWQIPWVNQRLNLPLLFFFFKFWSSFLACRIWTTATESA